MKYLFLIFWALFIFFFSCLIQEIVNAKKQPVKDFIKKKIKERKQVKLDPRFYKAMTILGGKKSAFIFMSICFFVLLFSGNLIFVMITAVFYIYIVWNIRAKKIKQRQTLIDKQVVESLTTIKNAVLSGKSIQDAIMITAQDIKEPLKTEFMIMSKNLNLGVSINKVLQTASQNAPTKEFKLMIDTISIAAQSGASISGIFERITDSSSKRIALHEKINALTAQGKMSGNIVSAVPFLVILMMSLLQPDMMNALFNTFIGNVLLLIVVIMVLIGSFVIRKLTEVDY
ncbi:MAG: type II secretion system F family protein [Elusimicrobiota bacterium]|jgi:tight adherence protein B|nr:type II secretion system F family protein [Elusimicrobiota bacterium]